MVAVVRQFTRGGRAGLTGPFLVALLASSALCAGPLASSARAFDMPADEPSRPAPPPSGGTTTSGTQPSSGGAQPGTTQPTGTPPSGTSTQPAPTGTQPSGTSTQPAPTGTSTQPAPTSTSGAPRPASSTQPTPSTAQASTGGPTEEVLEDDETADVGRHNRFRVFYLEASAGYSWVKLGLLREDNLIPDIARLDESGFAVGGGLGFFISFVTLGVQAEVARHDSFDLGTVMLDLGIRLPTRHLEPYLRFGIGYVWLFNNDLIPGQSENVRGVAANLGIGFDYMISPLVAIGVGADATVFNVRRAGVSGAPIITNIDLSEEGDAVGVQISALVQLSFHF
ncbi:MAG: outer membrane beta-barrel protein [Sandaracinaceae bacterium]|nr:outer membrane beta-barrel protein [Myxococcales bacterium]MCB9659686.1 outer membrane beta-barrel protein [Sandaracinaceae bacterium]